MNRYVCNALSNICGNIFVALLFLFFTPKLIASLGSDSYALFRIALYSVVSYAALLDIGINTAVKRKLSEAIHAGNEFLAKKVFGVGFMLYTIFGLLALILVASTIFWLPSLVNAGDLATPFKVILVAAGVYMLLLFYEAILGGIFVVFARYDITQGIIVLNRFLFLAGCAFLPRYFSQPLYACAVSVILVPILCLFIKIFFAKRVWKNFGVVLEFDKPLFKSMLSFGLFGGIFSAGPLIAYQTPPIIIANMMTLTEVTIFTTLFQLYVQLPNLAAAITSPIFPVAAKLNANKDHEQLRKAVENVIFRASLFEFSLIFPLLAIGNYFVKYWVGDKFSDCFGVLAILTVSALFMPIMYTLNHSLMAAGKIKKMSLYSFAMGIAVVLLSFLVLQFTSWGLYGVAGAIAVSFVVRTLLTFHDAGKQLGIGVSKFLFSLFLKAIPMAAVCFAVGTVLKKFWIPVDLISAIMALIVLGSLSFISGLFTLLPTDERKAIFRKIKMVTMRIRR